MFTRDGRTWQYQSSQFLISPTLIFILHISAAIREFTFSFFTNILQIQCDGESTSHQLSGHCHGEVANHSVEVQGSFSKLGQQHCTVWRFSCSKESLSIGGCLRHGDKYELNGLWVQTFKYLCSLTSQGVYRLKHLSIQWVISV